MIRWRKKITVPSRVEQDCIDIAKYIECRFNIHMEIEDAYEFWCAWSDKWGAGWLMNPLDIMTDMEYDYCTWNMLMEIGDIYDE